MIKISKGNITADGSVQEILAEICTLLKFVETKLGRTSTIPPILATFYAERCGKDTESQIKALKEFKKDVKLALEELDFMFKNKQLFKNLEEMEDKEDD